MVCDSGLHKSAECLGGADGIPDAVVRNAASGLRQRTAAGLIGRPRCPRCQAWVTTDGRCNNPKCPRDGQSVVNRTEYNLLMRCSAGTLDEATVGDVEDASYQMAYEGFLMGPDQNPYPEDDDRYVAFNQGGLKGTQDLEADGGMVESERMSAKKVDELLNQYAVNRSPNRRRDFEWVEDIDTWAYDTPDDVWDMVFESHPADDVAIMATPVRKFSELAEEIEAASPEDVENPTDTLYAPVPDEARALGIVGQHLDQIGPASDVEGARKIQAELQVAIAQAREGRWDSVLDLVGAQFDNGGGGRVKIVNVSPWPPGVDLRWAALPAAAVRSWRRHASIVVKKMSKPSVRILFEEREPEEWREQWVRPAVSLGPAEPPEPFEENIELIDQYERLGFNNGPQHYPARTYKVQLAMPPGESLTFDVLTRKAEDRLKEAEAQVVSKGDVEPVILEVERRPDGTAWVTARFDVVRTKPVW